MDTPSLDELQATIDGLFERVENATSDDEISQCNLALRVNISKKQKLGGVLTDRETLLIAAVGVIAVKKSYRIMQIVVLIIAFIIGLIVALKAFS